MTGGGLLHHEPKPWRLVETAQSIAIVPAETPRGFLIYFGFLAAIALLGPLVYQFGYPGERVHAFIWLCCIGMSLGFCLIAGVYYEWFRRERDRGPSLVIDFPNHEVQLPRLGRAWAFENVAGFDIVSGSWRGGTKYKKIKKAPSPRVELQMVVRENGVLTAWPLFGDGGWKNRILDEVAGKLGGRLGVPVTVINDDEGAPENYKWWKLRPEV